MKLRKYKKFSETSREVPEHRPVSYRIWQPAYSGRALSFRGMKNEDEIEDADFEEIKDEESEVQDAPEYIDDTEYSDDEVR